MGGRHGCTPVARPLKKKDQDYSGVESQFLQAWFSGTDDFQSALGSLRRAGVPGLVSAADGKGIFTEAGCASCHTLSAAEAKGTVGPNLDAEKEPKSLVVDAVTNGRTAMPSFQGTLRVEQIQAVAEFVSQNA